MRCHLPPQVGSGLGDPLGSTGSGWGTCRSREDPRGPTHSLLETLTPSASFQWDLRSSPRGPWAWSECPRSPGLSSLLQPLRHRPGWRSRPPRAKPPSLSHPDPLPCNKSVQAGGPQTWWASRPKMGVPFRSAPAWATQEALRWTRPWSTPGPPITGSPQPPRDDAVGPRTPFLPRGHCSSCPSLGRDGHSQGRGRVALSPLPRGPALAPDPLPSASTGQLDARAPRGHSMAVTAGAQSLWPTVTVPCLVSLSFPEGGTPPQRTPAPDPEGPGLAWPRALLGQERLEPPPGPALMGSSALGPWPGLRSGPGLREPSHSRMWPPGSCACPTDPGR
ncbi:hypothetical protein VULLAG_LOCUS12533 [Vulpes lagopus]